jgi:hypothetical protein
MTGRSAAMFFGFVCQKLTMFFSYQSKVLG